MDDGEGGLAREENHPSPANMKLRYQGLQYQVGTVSVVDTVISLGSLFPVFHCSFFT